MKGLMSLLERARLVRQIDGAGDPGEPSPEEGVPAPLSEPAYEPSVPVEQSSAIPLDQVYQAAGIPPCAYPAERLLRLMEGLKAMDGAMRLQTIQAIDAADDSWTIDDPIRDATAKLAAIGAHAGAIRSGITQAEEEARAQLSTMKQQQETSLADIRRQIADLEGLLAREVARGAQESAAVESQLQTKRDGATRELDKLSRIGGELQALVAQFNRATP